MLKTFITYGLSLLFLLTTFHVDIYHHDHHDGYSICEIGCDDEKHHSLSHDCEKCLNKNNRLIVQECIELCYDSYEVSLYSLDENLKDSFLNFNLYSRPPPSLF